MRKKVVLMRQWRAPPPLGANGQPIPERLWPQRRKHRWVVRWYAPGPDGETRRPSKSFAGTPQGRRDAAAFRDERQAEFNSDPKARRIARKVTLGEFTDLFVERGRGRRSLQLKAKSIVAAKASLDRLASVVGRDVYLQDLDETDAERFVDSLRRSDLSEGV